MPFDLALRKLRDGEVEEVYEIPGKPLTFKGVRLKEKYSVKPDFHRPSLDSSDTGISEMTSFNNAGFFFRGGSKISECREAHDIVEEYPFAHDSKAVVICAGKVYGAASA